MKRINIIISALAISALAASCAKESPSKSEVEAGFPNRFQGEIPEVSFSAGKATIDDKTYSIYVDTKVTVSGLGDNLDKVVIGCMNPKAGCAGSILNLLQIPQFNHQVEEVYGVLEEECSDMLTSFFKELRVRLKAEKAARKEATSEMDAQKSEEDGKKMEKGAE